MTKLNQLREFLLKSVAELKKHPEKLQVWTDDGRLSFKSLNPAPSYRNDYTVNVLITDYSGSVEALTMPIMHFYKVHYAEKENAELTFEAEIIDRERVDVLFKLPLFDKVIATVGDDGTVTVKPDCTPESQVPWFVDKPGQYTLLLDGKEVAKWTSV